MIGALLMVLALAATVAMPWPIALIVSVGAAFFSPLAPLAVGICTDALYYTHGTGSFPWATVIGGLLTLAAFFVRSIIETRIMRA